MSPADSNASLRLALEALEAERKRIDHAAAALTSVLVGLARRPTPEVAGGRRAVAKKPVRRKPKWTPAMKAAARARMKRFWAKKKTAQRPKARRARAARPAKQPAETPAATA